MADFASRIAAMQADFQGIANRDPSANALLTVGPDAEFSFGLGRGADRYKTRTRLYRTADRHRTGWYPLAGNV